MIWAWEAWKNGHLVNVCWAEKIYQNFIIAFQIVFSGYEPILVALTSFTISIPLVESYEEFDAAKKGLWPTLWNGRKRIQL
jgi:hypothetical protein